MITFIDCEKRAGLNMCPVCGHMAPDWCGESRADVTPEVVAQIQEEADSDVAGEEYEQVDPVLPKGRKKKVAE